MPYPTFADTSEIDRAVDRVVEAISAVGQRADFLFGAGMSVPAMLPDGRSLSRSLLRRIFPSSGEVPLTDTDLERLVDVAPLEVIAQATEEALGNKRDDLTRILTDLYLDKPRQPSKAHHDFASIAMWNGTPLIDRVFTTNFDILLETVFGDRAIQVFDGNTDLINDALRNGKIPIYHLHGVLDSAYQITERDVFDDRYYATHTHFRGALLEANAFVFVGYSMADPDFRRLYLNFRKEIAWRVATRGEADKTTYVVSPPASKAAYDLGRLVWKARGAVWIPLSAEEFFSRVKTILDAGQTAEMDRYIMTKFAIDRDEYEHRVSKLCSIFNFERPDAIRFLYDVRSKVGT